MRRGAKSAQTNSRPPRGQRTPPPPVWPPPPHWQEDIERRLDGGEPSNKTGWRVNVHAITPGVAYRDANVTVKAFAVPPGTGKHVFGYRFETADRTLVITGYLPMRNASGCRLVVLWFCFPGIHRIKRRLVTPTTEHLIEYRDRRHTRCPRCR